MSHRIKSLCLFLCLAMLLSACAPAAPDAAKARSRSVIASGGIAPAEELRVAEYLNYYEQDFPQPIGTPLGLDVRLGNSAIPAGGGEAWLQIGIQAREMAATAIAPLNLALVIDCSGSMDAPDKMPFVKQSLRVFLQSLAMNDVVSLIGYSDDAHVIHPAAEVGDGRWIAEAIGQLAPGGSTNLHAGMMLGFREVERYFDPGRNNQVILLTDGIANQGVTDGAQIAAAAKAYNDRRIRLSSIGLGQQFNDALLSQLAQQGQGAYHFIDSAAEMDKVFRREAVGMLHEVAQAVSAVIRPQPGVAMLELTGYDGAPPAGPIEVRLRDMGAGDSQVILARLQIDPGLAGSRSLVTVELRYTTAPEHQPAAQTVEVNAQTSASGWYDPLVDLGVLRNVTLQRSAEGLKRISQLYDAQRYQEAWALAGELERALRQVAALTGEAQMAADADMMRGYQTTLAGWVRSQTGREPDAGLAQPTRFYRGREFATPGVTTVEIH